MEWIHQNWQIVSFVSAHIGYLIRSEVKRAMHIDRIERHLEATDRRLGHLEEVTEKGISPTCQVHTQHLQQLEKRVDRLEGK